MICAIIQTTSWQEHHRSSSIEATQQQQQRHVPITAFLPRIVSIVVVSSAVERQTKGHEGTVVGGLIWYGTPVQCSRGDDVTTQHTQQSGKEVEFGDRLIGDRWLVIADRGKPNLKCHRYMHTVCIHVPSSNNGAHPQDFEICNTVPGTVNTVLQYSEYQYAAWRRCKFLNNLDGCCWLSQKYQVLYRNECYWGKLQGTVLLYGGPLLQLRLPIEVDSAECTVGWVGLH